jgi:hypothetical protein
MLGAALDLADRGWAVFPLAGKVPAIPNPHRRDSPERAMCRGQCGLPGHGMRDATCDPVRIETWWARTYPGANIGARVPQPLLVLDVDPRHGGTTSLAHLEVVHGPLPQTLTVLSGRGDGGRHLYWRHPGGAVSARGLPAGLDLKTHSGYCVMPPSIHPEGARGPYTWATTCLPAVPPEWLIDLLTPTTPAGSSDCPGVAGSAGQVLTVIPISDVRGGARQ